VAIPLFGPFVSPRFGYAPQILLVEIEGGNVVGRWILNTAGMHPWQQMAQLRSLGVDTVICGGISGQMLHQLQSQGIVVINEVGGEAKDALRRLMRGTLRAGIRCRGRRCWRGPFWARRKR